MEDKKVIQFPTQPEIEETGSEISNSASPKVRLRADEIVAALHADLAKLGAEENERRREKMRRTFYAGIVFAYWAKKFKATNALLDDKRERLLVKRLEENGSDLSELLWALDGARKDEFWRNVRRIDVLLRDRASVEEHAERMRQYCDGEVHPIAAKYAHAEAE